MAAAVDLEMGRKQASPFEQVGHFVLLIGPVCVSVTFFSFVFQVLVSYSEQDIENLSTAAFCSYNVVLPRQF